MRNDLYGDMYETESHHFWHIAKREYVEMMIKKYTEKKVKNILDIGCGTGKNMEELSKIGTVFGVDSSSEALGFCKKRGIVRLKKGFAEKIPYESERFDVVTILDVLEHVNDKGAVTEMERVLKKKGIVIITVPAFPWLWSRWDEILGHKKRYTKETLLTLFNEKKWEVKKISYIHSFLVVPTLIIRAIKTKQKKEYASDFQLMNPFINGILHSISLLEQMVVKRYDMPFGTSLLCVIQKK